MSLQVSLFSFGSNISKVHDERVPLPLALSLADGAVVAAVQLLGGGGRQHGRCLSPVAAGKVAASLGSLERDDGGFPEAVAVDAARPVGGHRAVADGGLGGADTGAVAFAADKGI